MYKFLFLLVICPSVFWISCSNEADESEKKVIQKTVYETNVKEVEKDLLEEQKQEVLRVEKKAIVFFIISKNEAQNVTKEIGESYKWETEALLANFLKQAGIFKNVIQRHNIQCFISNNKRFEIILKKRKVVTFDRIKEDQIMGEILTNGEKEPLICYGMYRNKELAELIQNYFGINYLGYVEPDSLSTQSASEPLQDSIN